MKPNARSVAWRVLGRVERDGAFADLALHGALRDSDLPRRDRAFATELTYSTLRLRGRLDAALVQCVSRPFEKLEPALQRLLRLGAYQIMGLHDVHPSVAVHESVELAKTVLPRAAGLTNAVLRKLSELDSAGGIRFPSLDEDPLAHLMQWGSLPEWLAQRWLDELGPAEAAELAEALLRRPPRTVRVSDGADLEAVTNRLRGRRARYAPRGVSGLRSDPVREPGFARGEFSVQDEASQLVPLLLGIEPGESVVDCCAAPGSKTAQLAEAVGPRGEVVAFELHASRLSLIHRQLKRLGQDNVRVLQRDVRQGFDLRGRTHYRRILVDAPCSGLGTLQRNPDARWRLRPQDIEHSAELAGELLRSAARYVEPGGVLVYSVCTSTPEETDQVVERFTRKAAEFSVDDPRPWLPPEAHEMVGPDSALRTWPHRHRCDGFFAVRLRRA
ncbi:MAG: 16S rRNA (cytosine(967)-C(5))-methyltransferase RsmB [Proteobacteria bacterium]|nr:16S rRNA (cytosine(967)-C(5))-methyltransferase RsmB [Pseudomonadota bacterium]